MLESSRMVQFYHRFVLTDGLIDCEMDFCEIIKNKSC